MESKSRLCQDGFTYMSEQRRVTRAAGIVGSTTLLSRILGLVRDMVIFRFFSRTATDSFYLALTIPAVLRYLLAEGAMTVSFLPVLTDYLKKGRRQETREVVAVVFTFFGIILGVVSILGVITAPWLVKLLAPGPGFSSIPEKYQLTITIVRIIFPYLFFVAMTSISMGILNSLDHFLAPALSPALWNVGVIIGAVVFSQYFEQPIFGAAVGVLLGGLMQLILQLPFLRAKEFIPYLSFQFRHPALGRVIRLMGAAILGLSAAQISVVIIRQFASYLGEGAVSYLYAASRLIELPYGIFAFALGTAVLPSLSRHATDGDLEGLKETLSYGLRMVLLLTIPAMVGLIVLSFPIVKVLFQRGAFDLTASIITSQALVAFAIGLWAGASIRVFAPAFYALKKPIIPTLAAIAAVILNIIVCFLLFKPFEHVGLALGRAIAVIGDLVILVVIFRVKYGPFGFKDILVSGTKSLIASAVMGGVVFWMSSQIQWRTATVDFNQVSNLFLSIILGGMVYLGVLWMLRGRELRELYFIFKRRK
ncbi:murein biosynthesis integral membrane protein MurJ [Bdellovibrionota bacterium]